MGSLFVTWLDERLAWNTSEWNGVRTVNFKLEEVWRPLLVHENSAIGIEVLGDNSNHRSIPVIVFSNGFLYWLSPAYLVSFCQVDVSKFPFDTQTCQFEISSWMFGVDTINFIHIYDYISLSEYEQNGEFEVLDTFTSYKYDSLGITTAKKLVFGVQLKRRYSYYLVNLVLPVLVLQALGIVIFLVPASSGEKLSFAFTLLLSLTVLMSIVSEKVPTTSLQVSTLSIYLLGGAFISGLEVMMTVISLILQHRQDEGKQLTPGLRNFTTKLYNIQTCLKNKPKRKVEPEGKNISDDVSIDKDIMQLDLDVKSAWEEVDKSSAEKEMTYKELNHALDQICVFGFSFLTITLTLVCLFRVAF
ncbi:neuronal acetylcholine receptor subunit alpha-7-like [Mya arenaria]|uniref:neuronal acetylcholine receptor subunit alpha-7-like n=1 Tax=Mya arenaria TaxID=6604 RepID=UPI0022E458A7|nr:neuronal acetylcholine receptor subunit alpha-7-like [Mya arenaria]